MIIRDYAGCDANPHINCTRHRVEPVMGVESHPARPRHRVQFYDVLEDRETRAVNHVKKDKADNERL